MYSAVHGPDLPHVSSLISGTASQQLPRLVRQAQKSGLVRHVGSGGNVWSNVHIDDLVDAYRLALEKGTPPGTLTQKSKNIPLHFMWQRSIRLLCLVFPMAHVFF